MWFINMLWDHHYSKINQDKYNNIYYINMAEIAIPIIALGSLYITSKNKKGQENFQNERKSNMLRPSDTRPQQNKKQTAVTGALNTNEVFHNPNESSQKYYEKGNVKDIQKINQQENVKTDFESLTGQSLDVANFKHNNMQPFFGSKVRGGTADAQQESILDNMLGSGSQQRTKEERAPLFKPSTDNKFINGAPNMSEFYLSRVNASHKQANTKPWEEERVAPGLGKGFTTDGGDDGFNNGMALRETWAPKDVNELRVKNNPKQTFTLDGLEGPAGSKVHEMGKMGRMEKHTPDTFFINNKERWLLTGAGNSAPTRRSEQMHKDQNRSETSMEYTGITGNASNNSGGASATYAPHTYLEGHKQQLDAQAVLGGISMSKNAGVSDTNGREGFNVLTNNRSSQKQPESTGFMSSVVGSMMAPLLDTMRPGRKENTLKNLRECGNINGVAPASYVDNQKDSCPKTIREINGSKFHMNIQGQGGDAYHVTEHQKVFNQRDKTNYSTFGNVGGSVQGLAPASNDSAMNQRDNPYKEATTYNRFEHGASSHFNNGINVTIDKNDQDRNNNRMFVPTDGPTANIGVDTMSRTTKVPQLNSIGPNRMDGDLLNAFKKNPYTHSLHSAP